MNELLPYLKQISDALERINGTGSSARGTSAATVLMTGKIDTSGVEEQLREGLITQTEDQEHTTDTPAVLKMGNDIVAELRRDLFTTVTEEVDGEEVTVVKSRLALMRDEIALLKEMNLREIMSHISIEYTTGGDPYLNFDIGIVGESYGSFGGVNTEENILDLSSVWDSLVGNTDQFQDYKINPYHIPIGSGLSIRTESGQSVITADGGGIDIDLSNVPVYSLLYVANNYTLDTLSPNTTTTKKFLSMTGTGSAGDTPAWAQLAYADISNLSSWPGSANITTLGTVTTGTWNANVIAFNKVADHYLAGTKTIAAAAKDTLLGINAFTNDLVPSTSAASYVYWDTANGVNAWHFKGNIIADGFGSFGGADTGGQAISLATVWASLTTNTDAYQNDKINPYHIPIGSGLTIRTESGHEVITADGGGIDIDLSNVPQYSMLHVSNNYDLTTFAPNTTTTKKFLSMTGTGTAGGAPTWAQLAYADISDLSSWTGSTNITTLGTIATGTWNATEIAYGKVAAHYIAGTRTIASAAQDTLKGIIGICNSLVPTTVDDAITDSSYIYWDSNSSAWHFKGNIVADGYGSFGGADSSGADFLSTVWTSLTTNTDTHANEKIDANHIPLGTDFSVYSNVISVNGLADLKALAYGTNGVYFVRTDFSGGLTVKVVQTGSTYTKETNTLYIEANLSS